MAKKMKKPHQCPSCLRPLTFSHSETILGIYNHTFNVYDCVCGYKSSLIEEDEFEISNMNAK